VEVSESIFVFAYRYYVSGHNNSALGSKDISVVADTRGFIFGPPIALAIRGKFVPLRKPRKLLT
ncbi:Adenine phosphoribosyltransferase 1, partial [Linum perenne]